MTRIPCPPEKQCTKIKLNGTKCTNARYGGYDVCYQHCDAGQKKLMSREKKGKLFQLSCDTCHLKDDCPERQDNNVCAFKAGLKAYDLNDPKAYKRLLEKMIQMEVEAYMRAWSMEKNTGEGGDNVSKRFMRLMTSMSEFNKLGEREEAKKPQSLADLIKSKKEED